MVFLFDVDNTLLDNDQLLADFRVRLTRDLGAEGADRYWAVSEVVRSELGYVDYLETLQRYRRESCAARANDSDSLALADFLLDYPFAERLYPRVFELIGHLDRFGPTVIVTDGDVVLQPRKIRRSGLWAAVAWRLLIFVHKEQMIDTIRRRYPAQHYVMVDDKPQILSAMKRVMREQLTTVLPLQGHYALDARLVSSSTLTRHRGRSPPCTVRSHAAYLQQWIKRAGKRWPTENPVRTLAQPEIRGPYGLSLSFRRDASIDAEHEQAPLRELFPDPQSHPSAAATGTAAGSNACPALTY